MLSAFIKQKQLPESFRQTAEQYFKPLAHRIFHQFKKSNKTYFVGINGCQGSGKSTLTEFLSQYIATHYHLNVVVMSLDDFYFSTETRDQLAESIHPLLATRGVPGTHNITALEHILSQLEQREIGFSIPKFNKAIDEPYPEDDWNSINKTIDIVLLEGWCWGVKAQTDRQLKEPINALESTKDPKGVWRKYVNQQLKNNYEPLYKKMDFWLFLQAPSFDCVYKWRLEQEQKLKINTVGLSDSKIMSPADVLNFIQYFQRLTLQEFNDNANAIYTTFYLGDNREITDTTVKDNE